MSGKEGDGLQGVDVEATLWINGCKARALSDLLGIAGCSCDVSEEGLKGLSTIFAEMAEDLFSALE